MELMKGFWEDKQATLRAPIYGASLLIGLSLLVSRLSFVVFFALIPLVLYIERMNKLSTKRIRTDFYLFGVIVSMFANFFLLEASPNNWFVVVKGWFAFVAPLMAWLMISFFCGLACLLLGEALRRLPNTAWRIGLLPLLFALMEVLRSYLFAIMAYGPHGSLSPNFNWGALAVPASNTPVVYMSRFSTFFGLSAIVVVINICLLQLSRPKPVRYGLLLLVICFLSGVGWLSMPEVPSRVARLRIEVRGMTENQSVVDWTEKDWPPQGTDLLVLPEYSGLLESKDYHKILRRLSPNGLAVTSIRTSRPPAATNQLIFLNRNGDIVSRQDKTFLIPTGETLPYSLQLAFRAIRKQNAIVDFTYYQQLTPGALPEKPFVYNGVSYGALACSGVSALSEYSRLSDEGADILVNSASLSFLKPDSHYHVYARAMARYQAVSTGKPFVQASRSGYSFFDGQ